MPSEDDFFDVIRMASILPTTRAEFDPLPYNIIEELSEDETFSETEARLVAAQLEAGFEPRLSATVTRLRFSSPVNLMPLGAVCVLGVRTASVAQYRRG